MKRIISFLAATLAYANSQTVFSDLESDSELLSSKQFSKNQSLSPMFKVGNFGTNYELITNNQFVGRVEFNNGTHWGTVCNNGFNMSAAKVFCRSLSPNSSAISWTNAGSLPYDKSYLIQDQKPILMENVQCSGNEESLDKCQFSNISNCVSSDDVIVTCSGVQWNFTTQGNFRLVHTLNLTRWGESFQGVWGRAEVFNGSQWNVICDDYFNKNNARVFCRSLQLPIGDVEVSNAVAIRQKHEFYKNMVLNNNWYKTRSAQCLGTELSLNQCPYTRNEQICTHYEDVYVKCSYI